jgi:hypothetical protein
MMNMAIPSNYNTRPIQQSPTSPTATQTVQGTNNPNIQNIAKPKKEAPNPLLLWGSALAGTALVGAGIFLGVKSYRHAEAVKQIPQNLELIFGKIYSPEEAEQAVKTFQDLLKIKDKKTFIEKAFDHIKNEMGLNDVNPILEIIKSEKEGNITTHGYATWLSTHIAEDLSKEEILNTITHELKHIEQNRTMVKAGLQDQIITPEVLKELTEGSSNPKKARKTLENMINRIYGKVQKNSILPNSPEYKKAETYLHAYLRDDDAVRNYQAYRENPMEIEAFKVGDTMQKVIETIQNMKP